MRQLSAEWSELRESAWEWDPIGIGPASRQLASGEYECLIEQVLPLLQRGASPAEIVAHFDRFFPDHFGLPPQAGADLFAKKAIELWQRTRG